MSRKISRQIGNSFVLQKNQSDCGVACLSSIIKFYGGNPNQEKLRIESGTTKQGTTLLGLYQTALKVGFNSEGMQADITYLRQIKNPVILHVIIGNSLQHYVVCYHSHEDKYLIGDPSTGIRWVGEKELQQIWQTKKLLLLKPNNDQFIRSQNERKLQWKWFVDLIQNDSTILTTILVIGIAVAILSIATSVFAQVLIDKLIPSNNHVRIFMSIGFVLLLLFAKGYMNYIRQMLMLKQGLDINVRTTNSFFSSLLLVPMTFFSTRKTGDIVARLNDISKIQQTITYLFGELLINILILIVSFIAIFLYSHLIAFVLLCGIPIFAFIATHYHKIIVSSQRETMAAHAQNESNFINTINNIIPVKNFGKEKLFAKIGEVTYGLFQKNIYQLGKIGTVVQLYTGLTGIIITITVIAVASFQMIAHTMTSGEFMAVFSLSGTIIPTLASIAFANIQLQGARIAFERMYEFSGMEKESDSNKENAERALTHFEQLQIKEVNFRYPGRPLLLKNINLKIKKGEFVTIFGDNGTGKSTLLSLIQRFYVPEYGHISINGLEVNTYSINSYRKLIAVIPQAVTLINAPLLNNITMSDSEEEIRNAVEVLNKYGLSPFFENFPQGFQTMIGEGGIQISGGQKQLVGLARALVASPELLLIDELTAHMDRATEQFTMNLLTRLKQELGILSITHNVVNASQSDNIIVISRGQIEAVGCHRELLKTDNLYSDAWHAIVPCLKD